RRHTRSKRDWSSDVCSSDLDPRPCQAPSHLGIRRAGGRRPAHGTSAIVKVGIIFGAACAATGNNKGPSPKRKRGIEFTSLACASGSELCRPPLEDEPRPEVEAVEQAEDVAVFRRDGAEVEIHRPRRGSGVEEANRLVCHPPL